MIDYCIIVYYIISYHIISYHIILYDYIRVYGKHPAFFDFDRNGNMKLNDEGRAA